MIDERPSPPPELRQVALDAARADLPSRAELASIARALPLPGGQPPVPSALPGAIVGALLGLAVVAGGMAWEALHAAPSAPATEGPVPLPIAPIRSAEAASPDPSAEPAPPRPDRTRSPASAPHPSSLPPTDGPSDDAGTPDAADAADADPETEAQLLHRALGAIGRSPAEALELVHVHQRRFPAGALVQEREVLTIDALLRLGRTEEARSRGARFIEAYPSSLHRRRVEALLGE